MRLFTAMVSGGTPRLMFSALAKISSPWCRIFSAALMSALVWWPQLRHLNIAWLARLPGSTELHLGAPLAGVLGLRSFLLIRFSDIGSRHSIDGC